MILKNAVVKNVFTGKKMRYKAVVIGVSTGGLNALSKIIPLLPKNYPLSVIIVQHRIHDSDNFLVKYLNKLCDIHIKEAIPRETIEHGCVYISPSGYHLMVERDKTFSLSVDPPVSFAIPSIDVLFESASLAYKDKLIGVVLTGANSDGSKGIKAIKDAGGLTIAQDPETAEASAMPGAATKIIDIDHIMPLEKIAIFLKNVNMEVGK